MSLVRFAAFFRRETRQFFRLFTFECHFECLYQILQWSDRKVKLYTCSFFGLYIAYTVPTIFRFLYTFYCIFNNQPEVLRGANELFYQMIMIFDGKHTLLMVATFNLLLFALFVTLFVAFVVPRLFITLFKDFRRIYKFLGANHLDTLSLIQDGPSERVKQEFLQVCHRVGIKMNPFMKLEDRYHVVLWTSVIDIFYFLSAITLVSPLLVLTTIFAYTVLNFAQLSWLSGEAFSIYLDVYLGFFQQSLLGIVLSLYAECSLYSYIETASITWNREASRLIQSSKLLDQSLRSRFKRQRILFVQTMTHFRFLNRFAIGRFFTVAISLNLVANIILVIEILIGDLNFDSKIWASILVFSQMVVIFLAAIGLIRYSENFYRISKHYQSAFVRKHRAFDFRKCLSLGLFLETLRPKRKFQFQLGPLSRLNRKALLDFWFFYSSTLMFILPFIVEHQRK